MKLPLAFKFCPNCDRQMKVSRHIIDVTPFTQVDYDGPEYASTLRFKCPYCKIKYDSYEDEYTVPADLERPTEAQLKFIESINYHLGLNFNPLTKRHASKLISENKSDYELATRKEDCTLTDDYDFDALYYA